MATMNRLSCIIRKFYGVIMNRRRMLSSIARASIGIALLPLAKVSMAMTALNKSKAEWRKLLPAPAYAVLFEEDTERPGSSPLNDEKRNGTYVCAACYLPLFKSEQKYDSATGWPSFFDALPTAIGKRRDFKLIWPRTEYHCARCGGHQGHVFDDGPKPTGLRYCNNGLALQFVPSNEKLPELRT
jgi:peptide-methionine (R)-S-oxide reductase